MIPDCRLSCLFTKRLAGRVAVGVVMTFVAALESHAADRVVRVGPTTESFDFTMTLPCSPESSGEARARDNWTVTLTAGYRTGTTTVTGAFWKTNSIGPDGPVIRDMGRIVFGQAVDDINLLDSLWSAGTIAVVDSAGPHEYFNLAIPWPDMYCAANAGA